MSKVEEDHWNKIMRGIIAKFKTGFLFGNNVVFPKSACEAMYKLLQSMTNKLDIQLALQEWVEVKDMTDEQFDNYLDNLREYRKILKGRHIQVDN